MCTYSSAPLTRTRVLALALRHEIVRIALHARVTELFARSAHAVVVEAREVVSSRAHLQRQRARRASWKASVTVRHCNALTCWTTQRRVSVAADVAVVVGGTGGVELTAELWTCKVILITCLNKTSPYHLPHSLLALHLRTDSPTHHTALHILVE